MDLWEEGGIVDRKKYNSVAALIVTERSMKGWTQKDLADRIGLSTALVGRWETGDVVLTRRNAELVADAFGIDRETVVMMAFVDRIAESRRKSHRKIQREYAEYPKVLKLAETMMPRPKSSDAIAGVTDESLEVDRSQLELALDSMEAGVYIRDIAGNLIYVNDFVAKTMQMDKEELVGRNIRDFDIDPGRVDETTRQLLDTDSYTGKIEVRGPDNTRLVAVNWCYLIRDAHDEPIAVIGLLHLLESCREMINTIFSELLKK